MGRIVGIKLGEKLGTQVVVENRGGGGTIIGTELVARSAPDGYTLLFANPALVAAPALNEKLPYDTLKALTSVIMVAASFNALVTHPTLPVKSVRELVALARAKPNQLNYSSAGEGSAIHLAMAQFENATGIQLVHIPYKGAGPALTDVVAGHVPMMFIATPPAIGYINAGRLRALGVSSIKRLAVLPNVPTVAESGVPGFEVNNWYAVVAPAETPKPVIGRLNAEMNALLEAPDVRERIASLGAEPAGGTPEQFQQRMRNERDSHGKGGHRKAGIRKSGQRNTAACFVRRGTALCGPARRSGGEGEGVRARRARVLPFRRHAAVDAHDHGDGGGAGRRRASHRAGHRFSHVRLASGADFEHRRPRV
jgi:tripartite-type tricarboxylate transporter receptor subunit TctC